MSDEFATAEAHWIASAKHLLSPLYQQSHRHYHALRHIETLLNLQKTHAHLVKDHLAVTLSIWFHDAIYDSMRDDNEEQSALLAEQTLSAWACPVNLTESVASKIRSTQGHAWTDGDPDTAVFLDFDLGILAAPDAAYRRYADQVGREYAWVPPEVYRLGRAKVLRSFLDRSVLYFTPILRDQWELAARANLEMELSRLELDVQGDCREYN